MEIKKLRKTKGLTQAKLASLVNVSPRTVQAWEQGRRSPSGSAQRLLTMILSEEVKQ